jgi:pentatricopeptide repeat protein
MPDLVSYNTLMSCFAREGHYRKVEALLQEMQQAHIEPDVYTCSTVVQAYGKANLLPKAVRAFEDMKAAGYRPNVIVYNSLLTTLSKALMPKYASEVGGGGLKGLNSACLCRNASLEKSGVGWNDGVCIRCHRDCLKDVAGQVKNHFWRFWVVYVNWCVQGMVVSNNLRESPRTGC